FFHQRLVLVRAQCSGSGKDGSVRIQKILAGGADTFLVGPFIEHSRREPEVFQRLEQGAEIEGVRSLFENNIPALPSVGTDGSSQRKEWIQVEGGICI